MGFQPWWPVFLLAGALVLVGGPTHAADVAKGAQQPPRNAVHIEIRNGLLHVTSDAALAVPRLDGWMLPKPGQTVSLDRKNSFTLQIEAAETRMKAEDLASLMNEYLLPHARAPIKNLKITFDGGMIALKGDLHKAMDVPFEGKGTVSIADPSDICVHITQLKAAGVLHKGLLDALGLKLAKVAQPKKTNRFYITGDDIILPIGALFPPPRISGTLMAVRIEGDTLVQVLGPASAKTDAPPVAANEYIYFHGGQMEFGKLTMHDVDLELLNLKPAARLDFSLEHYYDQLEQGYTKSLPDRGLVVYMPGYAMIAPQARPD